MVKVDWKKDYQGEFSCIYCGHLGLKLNGKIKNKQTFICRSCQRRIRSSHTFKKGYLLSKIEGYGLACPSPNCNARQVVLHQIKDGKKVFRCSVCGVTAVESNDLTQSNLSRYAQKSLPVQLINDEDDIWDLRSINASINTKRGRYLIYFEELKIYFLKEIVKKFVRHLCQLNRPYITIDTHLTSFRDFSDYLNCHSIQNISQINRSLILDFIATGNKTEEVIRKRLRSLRQLFNTGNIHGWFQIDPDIIRDTDYPKPQKSNPDPLPDIVREQIEKNLHKLPEPIARMWIICFFAAMRPYELALLKKDCLVQQGDQWSLVWERSKGTTFHQHSVPITRTIARVVQEQKAYIEELWGKDWEHLFCHYHNISQSDSTHPKLKPVKKAIPEQGTPLQKAITTLIETENILDDNDQLAKFTTCLIRPTRLTELFHKGHDLAVVSAWAGHKRLATTTNFYIEVNCQQIADAVGHIQKALVNVEGKPLLYESMPKSFWENPIAHELRLSETSVNTPIYGYCGLPLDEHCEKFRACYTCSCFVAKPEKLPLYIQQRDELRRKEGEALANGDDIGLEHFSRQADQLDKIIEGLQEVA